MTEVEDVSEEEGAVSEDVVSDGMDASVEDGPMSAPRETYRSRGRAYPSPPITDVLLDREGVRLGGMFSMSIWKP